MAGFTAIRKNEERRKSMVEVERVFVLKWFAQIDERLENHSSLFWVLLIFLVVGGVVLMAAVTPHGIGLVNDSVGYVAGARNLLAGQGFSRLTGDGSPRPITNYPPLFSIVLAGLGLSGVDAIPAAHGLNVVLMGVNVLLIGLTIRRATRSPGLALLGGLIFLISGPVIRSHSFAMSEPLYLSLAFGVLLLLAQGLQTRQWGWLVASGFLASLAFLTRYVGISLYATGAVALLVLGHAPPGSVQWGKRIRYSLIFLGAGVPAVAVWLGRNYAVTSNVGNRQFLFHPIPLDKINEGLLNFWGWLLPERGGFVEKLLPLWGIVLVLLVLALTLGVVREAVCALRGAPVAVAEDGPRLTWLYGLQALVYLAVLLLSMMFVDASPIFEDRILLLLEVPLIVLGMAGLGWLWRRQAAWMQWTGVLLAVFLLFSLTEDSLDAMRQLRRDGQGFAHSAIQESQVIAAAKALPEGVILYSNRVTALYIVADLPAYVLPSPLNPATQKPREGYEEDVALIRQKVLEGQGAIVIFNYYQLQQEPEEAVWIKDLTEGIPLLGEYDDGAIFGELGNN